MSLFYSNPPCGRASNFTIPCESVDASWIVLIMVDLPPTFAHFPPPTLAHFLDVVFFFNMIWIFLRHINVFNVRHYVLNIFLIQVPHTSLVLYKTTMHIYCLFIYMMNATLLPTRLFRQGFCSSVISNQSILLPIIQSTILGLEG